VYKHSASSLRALTQIQDTVNNGIRNWRMMFKGRDIGGAFAKPVPGGWQMGEIRLDNAFQGLGLGKKLYGGMLQSLKPGERLLSDAQVSPTAQATWQGLMNRKGPWTITPGLPGAAPQANIRPAGQFQGLHFPTQVYDSLKSVLPAGVKPYHYQALRTPTPVPQQATQFVNRLG